MSLITTTAPASRCAEYFSFISTLHYTLKAAASSAEPHDPYPFFWKPDFTAPGFAFAGLGGA